MESHSRGPGPRWRLGADPSAPKWEGSPAVGSPVARCWGTRRPSLPEMVGVGRPPGTTHRAWVTLPPPHRGQQGV